MSPRRRFDDAPDAVAGAPDPVAETPDAVADAESATNSVRPDYFRAPAEPARRRGLPLVAAVTAAVVTAAIAASALMLVRHEADRRAGLDDAAALSYARDFMTVYTTLDPANADAYVDRVLAQSTGEFATLFRQRQNEILVQMARSGSSVGTVLEAGVQRWNEDGSADVLLATKVATTTPDGKSTIESGSRWVATAIKDTTIKEGQQWRISNLVQVL